VRHLTWTGGTMSRAYRVAARRAGPLGWRRNKQGLWGGGAMSMARGAAAQQAGPVGWQRVGPTTAVARRSLVLQLTCALLFFPSSHRRMEGNVGWPPALFADVWRANVEWPPTSFIVSGVTVSSPLFHTTIGDAPPCCL
jgi:hypothetical protein